MALALVVGAVVTVVAVVAKAAAVATAAVINLCAPPLTLDVS
jgi:hypothetical protein